jgi:methionyl-tRNA synthetase
MDSDKSINKETTTDNTTDSVDKKEQRKQKNEEKKAKKLEAKEKKEKKKEEVKTKETTKKETTETKVPVQSKVLYYESNAKLVRHNKDQPIHVKNGEKNILITSALPYVNNVPHLGNLIGCVLSADVYARYCRAAGLNTLYICGTDEYGTATETKALEEKCTPKELCDKFHHLHKSIYDWFDIDFDYFGRTSTEVHTKITQEIFQQLKDEGYITKDEVEQFKCHNCDIFLSDRWIIGKCPHKTCGFEEARGDQCDGCGKLMNALELIDPKCKICKGVPSKIKSSHYFLELPSVEHKLRNWLEIVTKEWTTNSKSITYAFINDGLKPRCITRDLKWGVTVPTKDPDMLNKVFYVWFDAPIGYLSITENFIGGNKWEDWWKNPENVKLYQFMGKDNVTFHGVIFPSTLLGTGQNYTLVNQMSTTEYLNYENKKFSKTHNTGVFGDSAKNTNIPSEVWRYYLLASRPESSDTDFKWDDFMAKNNNELLANLGNLLHRILQFTANKFNKKTPKLTVDHISEKEINFFKKVRDLLLEYCSALDNVKIKEGLRVFMEISSLCNSYFQETEPWVIFKSNPEKCETVFNILLNFVRLLGSLAEPYMPSFSAKLYEILNINYDEAQSKLIKTINEFISKNNENSHMFLIKLNLISEGHEIRDPLPLFKKISEEEVAEFKKIYG